MMVRGVEKFSFCDPVNLFKIKTLMVVVANQTSLLYKDSDYKDAFP